jgi:DNA-binding MarR family transcriptional regulator
MTGQQDRSEDTRHNIADGLTCVSSLVVRYLTRGPGLTSRTVMASLAEDGPIRLTALAAASGVSQPAMTQCVDRMQREGLVSRLGDHEDARVRFVALTDAGRAARAEPRGSIYERLSELLDTLSPHDEAVLGMTMRVALPLIEQLSRKAATAQNCGRPRRSEGWTWST